MLLGLIAAQAAPCTFSAGDFRDHVVDAVNRLERDDLEVTGQILDDLRERMPCMRSAPDPNLLADLRVVQSVIAFVDGRNWEGPLAAALRIRPTVDRIVGRAHPTYGWLPDDVPRVGRPLDAVHRVYVDGRPATLLPAEPGWYVVQKTDGESWNTALYRGARPSIEWAESPVERAPALELASWISITGGAAVLFQQTTVDADLRGVPSEDRPYWAYDARPCVDPADCTFDRRWDPEPRGLYGGRFEGRAWFYGPTGLLVSGDYAFGLGVPYRTGRAVLLRRLGRWRVGAGIGAMDAVLRRRSTPVEDGTAVEDVPGADLRETLTVGLVALHVGWRQPGTGMEASLDVGFRPTAAFALQARMGKTWTELDDRVQPSVAGYLHTSSSAFEATGAAAGAYRVDVRLVQIGVAIGGRFRGRL